MVYGLKMEFCPCARGRQWCGIIHYYWWTASIKPRLLFSRAGYASWGLSLSLVYVKKVYPTHFYYAVYGQLCIHMLNYVCTSKDYNTIRVGQITKVFFKRVFYGHMLHGIQILFKHYFRWRFRFTFCRKSKWPPNLHIFADK